MSFGCVLVLATLVIIGRAEVAFDFKSLEDEARSYIRHLFGKYGNGQVMTFEGFEHLLYELGLGKLHLDHEASSHRQGHSFQDLHTNHNHEMNHDHAGHAHNNEDHDHEHHGNEGHGHDTVVHQFNETAGNNVTTKHNNLDSYDHEGHDAHSHEHHAHGHGSDNLGQGHDSYVEGTEHDHEGQEYEDRGEGTKRQVRDVAAPQLKADNQKVPSFASRVALTTDARLDATPTEPTTAVVQGEKCMSPSELLSTYKIDWKAGITENHFLYLGPALITQMDSRRCSSAVHHSTRPQVKSSQSSGSNSTSKAELSLWQQFRSVPTRVWLMATGAVVVLSLVGLVAVAMIPLMQRCFYQHLIQFLVALAVGSLTGDALLHLLPHAVTPHHRSGSHDHSLSMDDQDHSHDLDLGRAETGHDHTDAVWKGLVALAGIYAFFIMEQMVAILTRWKRRKKRRLATSFDPNLTLEDVGAKLSRHNDHTAANEDFMLVVHQSVRKLADDAYEEMTELKVCENGCHRNGESVKASGGAKNAVVRSNSVRSASNGSSKLLHSHSHQGHNHAVPHSVTAVAWMVIMGDGLHNFTDGLAIGAAFVNSVPLGLSTTVAVFCHELPHELGDFAMLLHAGMRVKQALFYNIFSSILCFIGMVIGIFVGNISSASSWVFALTAGIFIYIALVDMLPEVASASSESRRSGSGLCYLLLQLMGVTVGIVVMLLIALYEEEISIPLSDDIV